MERVGGGPFEPNPQDVLNTMLAVRDCGDPRAEVLLRKAGANLSAAFLHCAWGCPRAS